MAHLWFITLHPYEDGHGRLARAITDRALAQLDPEQGEALIRRAFGLSARIMKERKAYYAVLERTQRGGLEVSAWLAWFLEQVCEVARLHGAVVDAVQAKALFWWRHRHSGFNPLQRKLLNRLLDAEPEGVEGGMTLHKAASLTGVSRATAWRDLSELVALQALEPGPIRSHPEDWGSAGSRHPKSLKSPLMSCANAAMPSVTDQIPFNRKLLIAMVRSMATI